MIKTTAVAGMKFTENVAKIVNFNLPQVQEYSTDGAEIRCDYNTLYKYSNLTKFDKNLKGLRFIFR